MKFLSMNDFVELIATFGTPWLSIFSAERSVEYVFWAAKSELTAVVVVVSGMTYSYRIHWTKSTYTPNKYLYSTAMRITQWEVNTVVAYLGFIRTDSLQSEPRKIIIYRSRHHPYPKIYSRKSDRKETDSKISWIQSAWICFFVWFSRQLP